jgi:tetratricopeptide (TPR) repeat protein
MFEHVCGGIAHHKVNEVIERAARRFTRGELPRNHHLEESLYLALGQAARVLAYELHDPERGPLCDLLQSLSSWPQFLVRLCEIAQNNILAGTPRDHWLAKLIDESKAPENFQDFSLDLLLDEYQITRLLRSETDAELREHVHSQFLAWVERHVADNGHKPSDFSQKVREGWSAAGAGGQKVAFYDVFCLFFREGLKEETGVFRAFSANILTGIKQDIEEIQHALPDVETLQNFTETLRNFEEKELDANYGRFKAWIRRQNEKLYDLLRSQFAAVQSHLEDQDRQLATIHETAESNRREAAAGFRTVRRSVLLVAAVAVLAGVLGTVWHRKIHLAQMETNSRIGSLEKLLQAQLKQASHPRDSGPLLDFPRALREWAKQYNLSEEQAERELKSWVEEVREHSNDLQERARAEFLAQRFAEAALLYDKSAAEKLSRSRDLATEAQRLVVSAVEDLIGSGNSLRAEGRTEEALKRFESAIAYIPQDQDPLTWAKLKCSIGLSYHDLGIRLQGSSASSNFTEAVAAFREALIVQTRDRFPREWAESQRHLGDLFCHQAEQSEGPDGKRLLNEAISTHREALQVLSPELFPDEWAMGQMCLGNALRTLAGRTQGTNAERLLREAVTAYRGSVRVFTQRAFRQAHVTCLNDLGHALQAQAELAAGTHATRLLDEAIATFREVLNMSTQELYPDQWAGAHAYLGTAMSARAVRSKNAEAIEFLQEAEDSLREALKVLTPERYPQYWAEVERRLGAVLLYQFERSDRTEARPKLDEAISTFRAVMKVTTREESPLSWAATQNSLASALKTRADLSDGAGTRQLLKEALASFRELQTVWTREQFPWQWAQVENNMGVVMWAEAVQSEGEDAVGLLSQAVTAYNEALEVRAEAAFPSAWAETKYNLGVTLRTKAELVRGTEGMRLAEKSMAAFEDALKVFTAEEFPDKHEKTSWNLIQAEEVLRKLKQ